MIRPFFARIARVATDIFLTLTEEFGLRRSRSLGLTGISCLGSTLLATGKLSMGILSLSLFTCLNAFYTFDMVAAKLVALTGVVRERNRKEQYRYCLLAALMLIAASLCYLLYTLYLYCHPSQRRYNKPVAIAIAAFAFAELGSSLWGMLRERRQGLPLFQTLKTINLSSALMALVLAQRAILSLSLPPEQTAGINAAFGALMALLSALLGIGLVFHVRRLERTYARQSSFARLYALMAQNHPDLKLCPAYCIQRGDHCYLGVHILDGADAFPELCREAETHLNLRLLDAGTLSAKDVLFGNI